MIIFCLDIFLLKQCVLSQGAWLVRIATWQHGQAETALVRFFTFTFYLQQYHMQPSSCVCFEKYSQDILQAEHTIIGSPLVKVVKGGRGDDSK